MRSSQTLDANKPWDAAINKIDFSLRAMKVAFEASFAENQTDLKPREVIKRGLFFYIWEKLSDKLPEFKNIHELDEYYQRVDRDFKKYVGEYLALDFVKNLSEQHHLIGPVSERKMEMLKKIIHLYHALARCKFLLQGLNQSYSQDKCEDMAHSLLVQSEVNREQLDKIDIELFQRRSVHALKAFNQFLVALLHNKGHGDVHVENLLLPGQGDQSGFSAFAVLNARLQELPSAEEILDLLAGKVFDSKAMRVEKISQHIKTIQTVRDLLRKICNEIYIASCDNVDKLASDYDTLLQIKQKISNSEELEICFRSIFDMKQAVEGETQVDASIPVLRLAARSAIEECGQQSQAEQLTRLAMNGWGSAGSCVKDQALAIIKLTRDISQPYYQNLNVYNQAINNINNQDKMFRDAAGLINEWRLVNQQMCQVLEQCDQLLGVSEARVIAASQTTGQFVGDFFKHHWPKMVIGAVIVAAPAAAVSYTVIGTAASAAVLIPAGVVLGSAGGAGVGAIKDHVSPPPTPVVKKRPNVSVVGVDSHYIIDRLFTPADGKLTKMPIKLNAATIKPRVSTPPLTLDVPETMPAVLRNEATELPVVTPVVSQDQQEASSWLPTAQDIANLPGQIAQIPGQIPGQVAALPSRFAAWPGQAFGLFTRRAQPASESPAAQQSDQQDNALKK